MTGAARRLRRCAALVMLAGAGVGSVAAAGTAAGATLDTFSTTVSAQQSRAGTAQAPARLGLGLTLSATPANGASYTAPVTDVSITLPGVRANPGAFPLCTAVSIATAESDSVCPAGALVATGELTANLWNPAVPAAPAQLCDPVIDVWNAGADRLAYFLRFPVGRVCAGLVSGTLAPWTGTLRRSGTALVDDIPLPPQLSTDTGGTGLFTGLASLRLQFTARTVSAAGHGVAFLASVGCVAGQRPYTVAVRAVDGTSRQLTRFSGSSGC